MNSGLLNGIKRLFVPASLGGNDPANDGLALVLDSTQEGGVRRSRPSLASGVAMVLRAFSSAQTGNMLEVLTSDGLLNTRISSDGSVLVGERASSQTHSPTMTVTSRTSAWTFTVSNPTGGTAQLGVGSAGSASSPAHALTGANIANCPVLRALSIHASSPVLVGRGAASQSGDYLRLEDSALAAVARILANGKPAFSEAANGAQGVATLVGGTVTVANTSVTANSRIILTAQSLGTVTDPKALAVTARTAGTSFTITSADATDTSPVAYLIMEPA